MENENRKENNNINGVDMEDLDKIDQIKDGAKIAQNNFQSHEESDIMVISDMEIKMKIEQKTLFEDKHKVFMFINKRSGSQEGKELLTVAAMQNKNFNISGEDSEIYKECYNKIIINKITNKRDDEIYVFSIDVIDHDINRAGVERLKNYAISGNYFKLK